MLRHNYMVVNMIFASNTVNYIPRIAHRCADVSCDQCVGRCSNEEERKNTIMHIVLQRHIFPFGMWLKMTVLIWIKRSNIVGNRISATIFYFISKWETAQMHGFLGSKIYHTNYVRNMNIPHNSIHKNVNSTDVEGVVLVNFEWNLTM